ncbi:MAG TPA: CTP synthase, partial [Solirubrobacterales bacterium]
LYHGGYHHGTNVEVELVDSDDFDAEEIAEWADGILIPGGFGERGIEGKINAARVAREQQIPYLGICLGMQIAVAEFARNVAGMDGANSTEFDPETPFPVVDLLPEQKEVSDMGGTMRLGADPVKIHEGTRAREIFGEAVIYKRHRHRFEVNNQLRRRLEDEGLVASGTSPDERLVEIIELADAYKSVIEALEHGGFHHGVDVEVELVDSENFEPEKLEGCDGILIPGGFGERGIEGKVEAARIAREKSIPYLGICLGMQIAVVEFARHVAGMDGANSAEFDPETPFPVVDLLPEQKEVSDMGGTMRLGADPVKLHEGTKAREIFGEAVIYKRHRHRYEVNNQLRRRLEDEGLVCGGTSPDERLVEMVELPDHPFFVASQYHPEFNSRPNRPEPLFREFVGAAARQAGERPANGGELEPVEEPVEGDVGVRRTA